MSDLRKSLTSLKFNLEKTIPHFVRCIKTNEENEPFKLDCNLVINQLKAFNISETAQVSAVGYSNPQTFEAFYERFYCLRTIINSESNLLQACQNIVEANVKVIYFIAS